MSLLLEYSKILKDANNALKRELDDSYSESLRLKAENARLKSDLLKLNTETIVQYATQLKLYEAQIQQLLKNKLSDPSN